MLKRLMYTTGGRFAIATSFRAQTGSCGYRAGKHVGGEGPCRSELHDPRQKSLRGTTLGEKAFEARDLRHVDPGVVKSIMQAFVKAHTRSPS